MLFLSPNFVNSPPKLVFPLSLSIFCILDENVEEEAGEWASPSQMVSASDEKDGLQQQQQEPAAEETARFCLNRSVFGDLQ